MAKRYLNRKKFLKILTASGALASTYPQIFLSGDYFLGIEEVIRKAGNTNDEKERAEIISKGLEDPSINELNKKYLKDIFYVADHWANSFEKYANPGSEGNESKGYLCSFFLFKSKIDRFLLPKVDEENTFYPLIAFYRSRMLAAQLIQNGKISGVPETRDKYIKEITRLLNIAKVAFPENELAQNYLGKYKVWEELVEINPKAPEWANIQRMILEKLIWLIHWWIDNRQISDGQFGGGWGDDVEIWRKWMPVLFAFEDRKAITSQEKLFEGLFGLSRMKKGYTEYLNDVEHTSEEYSDPIFCMLNLQPENPVWEQRAIKVLDYIETTWTGENNKGQLQFKSTWFNVDRVHEDKKRACDTPYHTRLVQPLMLLWLRTGDQRIEKFLTRWLKTWVNATFDSTKGKPYGIVPAAIHWPDGKPAGMGENWWHPENYHTKLYDYPSQQTSMYECFLQAYHITRDDLYLKPIRFIADKRIEGLGNGDAKDFETGSLEWCLAKLKKGFTGVLVKYKLITGDISYDNLIYTQAGGYDKYLIDRDTSALAASLNTLRSSLGLPLEFYTSEVRWTDRLFAFNKYFNLVLEKPIPNFNADFLFSSLTGSIGNVKILPVFGVKWLTPPTDIAILAEKNTKSEFIAQLFHFGNEEREMQVRFLNLNPGMYIFKVTGSKEREIEISSASNLIDFVLLSQKLSRLEVINLLN